MNNFGFNISMRNTPDEIRELGRECLNTGLYKAVEITYYEDMQDIDTFAYNAAIREILAAAAPQVLVHISGFNISEENCALRSAILHEFTKCCQYTKALGGREIIMHCGRPSGALHVPVTKTAAGNDAYKRAWALSVQMYRSACAIAADYGMEVYAENLNTDHLTVRCAQVRQMVEEVGCDNLHIVFDIGHCHHTGGDIPRDVLDAGDLLRHLHLHDNHGKLDEHLPLGEGTIDYAAFTKALREVNYPGLYMMELNRGTPENLKASREKLIACM